jgi:hypothetical protein
MDLGEIKLIRAISKIGKRLKVEVSSFSGNFNLEESINWINDMEEYFKYEEIKYLERVKFAKSKLKGHASIWWKEFQLERNRRGKEKITRWDWMVEKLKI